MQPRGSTGPRGRRAAGRCHRGLVVVGIGMVVTEAVKTRRDSQLHESVARGDEGEPAGTHQSCRRPVGGCSCDNLGRGGAFSHRDAQAVTNRLATPECGHLSRPKRPTTLTSNPSPGPGGQDHWAERCSGRLTDRPLPASLRPPPQCRRPFRQSPRRSRRIRGCEDRRSRRAGCPRPNLQIQGPRRSTRVGTTSSPQRTGK